MFCFCQLKLSRNHRNSITYRCNIVHAVNFRQELVLENATSGSLKVLEKSLNFNTKRILGTLLFICVSHCFDANAIMNCLAEKGISLPPRASVQQGQRGLFQRTMFILRLLESAYWTSY